MGTTTGASSTTCAASARDGKIAEDWHIFHAFGLWQQLIPEIGELLKRTRDTINGNVDVHG